MRAILVAAIAGLASTAAQAQVKESIVVLKPNFISTFTLDKPFKTVLSGNEKIVIATAEDDRTVVLRPQGALGQTNIIFLDQRNVQIASINVVIDGVKIHNRKLLSSFNVYQCSENRCVDELTAKE